MQWRQPSVRMLGCHGGRQAQRWVVQVFKAVAPKEMMPVEHLRSDKGETQVFEGQYVLWGGEHSLFTRKLQAMLNYLAVPYTFKLKSEASQAAVEARLGTHFIPGLETPEGWFLHDTTPIGLMLNHKYPDRPLLPKTPVQKIAAHLLEDWADEWFGRYAINSRWCYPDNVAAIAEGFYANRIGRFQAEGLSSDEKLAAAELIQTIRDNFGLRACHNRGCGPDQSAQVRRDFDSLMQDAAVHFSEQPYLLGGCASLGDFTFAGLFKAHIASDPEPRRWIEASAPSLLRRMNEIFESESSRGEYWPGDALPKTLTPFFHHMRDTYHEFLKASRLALAEGEKWCALDLGDGPVSMRALKYSEVSRRHIRAEILALSNSERKAVEPALEPLGVLDAYRLPALPAATAV